MLWRISVLIVLLIPLTVVAQIEPDSTEAWLADPLAIEYHSAGKRALAKGQFAQAVAFFDSALALPFHPQTTSASYLRGLAWFQSGNSDSAMASFDAFLEDFPKSTYLPEVRYHRAILLAESGQEEKKEGYSEFIELWQGQQETMLGKMSRDKLRLYLFQECDIDLIANLMNEIPVLQRGDLVEAYCFCLEHKAREQEKAKAAYRAYLQEGGEPRLFLERLFDPRRPGRYGRRDEVNIAVFLPLFLPEAEQDSANLAPGSGKMALEFWEGLQMAAKEMEPQLRRKVNLRVFDSRRDSLVVVDQLAELDAWFPDLVIGDVFNTQTEVLSRWAEQTGTPQIVPFSPSESLVEGKSFTFLAHPPIAVHAKALAKYAIDSQKLKKIAVFTNGTHATDEMAEPFMELIRLQGAEIIRLSVDSVFRDGNVRRVSSAVRSIRLQGCDGVFIPIFGDQETVGLILSQLGAMGMDVAVLASPHAWKRFNNIDRDLKDRFLLTFSTSFMCDRQDSAYRSYLRRSLEQYHVPPSEYHTQGYDIGKWLLTVLNEYPFEAISLADYLRGYPEFAGLHQNFSFEGNQSNQYVNLGRFENSQVLKLTRKTTWAWNREDE